MTTLVGDWLPNESLYLDKASEPPVRPHRPLNQGDIFQDVTICLTNRSGSGEPTPKTKICHAMLIGHPCSLRGGPKLAALQNLVEVRPVKDAEADRFVEPWDSDFRLFPLRNLFPDKLWVADFNVIGTVHFKLLEDRRMACLSLAGWAALQRRYANHSLRIDQSIELRMADLRGLWNELALWEEWCARGHAEPDFYTWVRNPIESEGPYKGTVRLEAIELAEDVIRAELPEPVIGPGESEHG